MPLDDLAGIEGFDEDIANELQQRARTFLKEQNERLEARRQELGVSDEIAAIAGVTPALLVALGEKGVKTLDDLADLAGRRADRDRQDAGEARGGGCQRHHHGGARPLVRRRAGAPAAATAGGVSAMIGSGNAAHRPSPGRRRTATRRRRRAAASSPARCGRKPSCCASSSIRTGGIVPDIAGTSAGPGFVVDRAARYSGEGGGEAAFRAGGAGAGRRRRAGLADRDRGASGAALLRASWAWRGAPARRSRASTRSRAGCRGRRGGAGRGGRRRRATAAASSSALAPGVPVVDRLSCAELSAAFGREHVVHAALDARAARARRFVAEAARLGGFRTVGNGFSRVMVPDRDDR